MPQPVTGNLTGDPSGVIASLLDALAAANLIDDQVERPGPILSVTDSGTANGGDGGGNQPLVTCLHRHGLRPGDSATLTGTDNYDGSYTVEPAGDFAFLLDDVAFTVENATGDWS